MAQIFPFSSVAALQPPVESLELSGYMQGLEASKRNPNTFTAINRGIQSGYENYNKQVAAEQDQRSNELTIQNQEAAVARQPVIDEAERLKLEIAQLEAARAKETNELELKSTKAKLEQEYTAASRQNALATKEQEVLKTATSENAEEARSVLDDPKNKDLFILKPELQDRLMEQLGTEEQRTAHLAKKQEKEQMQKDAALKVQANKELIKSIEDFKTLPDSSAAYINSGLSKDPDADIKLAGSAVVVPADKYIEDEKTGKLSLDPEYGKTPTENAGKYLLMGIDGKKLTTPTLTKEDGAKFNEMALRAAKAGKLNKVPTEQDFTFLNTETTDTGQPVEEKKSLADRVFGMFSSEPAAVAPPSPTEKAQVAKKNVDTSIFRKRDALTSKIQGTDQTIQDRAGNAVDTLTQKFNPQGQERAAAVMDAAGKLPSTIVAGAKEGASALKQSLKDTATMSQETKDSLKKGAADIKSSINPTVDKVKKALQEKLGVKNLPSREQLKKDPNFKPVAYREYYDTKSYKKGTTDYVVKKVNNHPLLANEGLLVRAVAAVESGGKTDAVSHTGVKGLMQVTGDTAKELGFDPSDPKQNVAAGRTYLKQLAEVTFKKNVPLAVAAYNAGPGNILKALKIAGVTSDEGIKNATWQDALTGLKVMKANGNLTPARFKEISEYPTKVFKYLNKLQEHDAELNTVVDNIYANTELA